MDLSWRRSSHTKMLPSTMKMPGDTEIKTTQSLVSILLFAFYMKFEYVIISVRLCWPFWYGKNFNFLEKSERKLTAIIQKKIITVKSMRF